jgi:hypothetical protein
MLHVIGFSLESELPIHSLGTQLPRWVIIFGSAQPLAQTHGKEPHALRKRTSRGTRPGRAMQDTYLAAQKLSFFPRCNFFLALQRSVPANITCSLIASAALHLSHWKKLRSDDDTSSGCAFGFCFAVFDMFIISNRTAFCPSP